MRGIMSLYILHGHRHIAPCARYQAFCRGPGNHSFKNSFPEVPTHDDFRIIFCHDATSFRQTPPAPSLLCRGPYTRCSAEGLEYLCTDVCILWLKTQSYFHKLASCPCSCCPPLHKAVLLACTHDLANLQSHHGNYRFQQNKCHCLQSAQPSQAKCTGG